MREGLSSRCLLPHLGLRAAVGQSKGRTPSQPCDLSRHPFPHAVKLGRPERSAAAHGGHSVWGQLSGRGGASETLMVSLRKLSPREGGDPTLIPPAATQKSSCIPCPSCWRPCRARGCLPGQTPAPWGLQWGVWRAPSTQVHAAHLDSRPLPPPHRLLGSLQTINSGLGFLTFPGVLSRVLASMPRREGWHLAPLACGEGSSNPPTTVLGALEQTGQTPGQECPLPRRLCPTLCRAHMAPQPDPS